MLTSMIAIVRVHSPMNEPLTAATTKFKAHKRRARARAFIRPKKKYFFFSVPAATTEMRNEKRTKEDKKKKKIVAPRSRWKRYYLFSRIYSISFPPAHIVPIVVLRKREREKVYSCYFIACGSFFADSHYGIGFHYHCHFRIRFEYLGNRIYLCDFVSLNSLGRLLLLRQLHSSINGNCHSTLCVCDNGLHHFPFGWILPADSSGMEIDKNRYFDCTAAVENSFRGILVRL